MVEIISKKVIWEDAFGNAQPFKYDRYNQCHAKAKISVNGVVQTIKSSVSAYMAGELYPNGQAEIMQQKLDELDMILAVLIPKGHVEEKI